MKLAAAREANFRRWNSAKNENPGKRKTRQDNNGGNVRQDDAAQTSSIREKRDLLAKNVQVSRRDANPKE